MNRHADPLYYPRTAYAQALVSMLAEGIASAFTLFAPRRMGKTQFLLNDVKPAAEEAGFDGFYFSFMDAGVHTELRFQQALLEFAQNLTASSKIKNWLAGIQRLDVLGAGITRETVREHISISEVLDELAQGKKPVLMLLDEVQELARIAGTGALIRSLRTGLDVNRGRVKVIFTGSSTNGLRQMFSDHKAPFFQFAHAMDFPRLGEDFSDFLAAIYRDRTGKELRKEDLHQWFARLEYIPLHLRTIIQNMILNPDLPLDDAARAQQQHMHSHSDYSALWLALKALDRLILHDLAHGKHGLYSEDSRQSLADRMGVDAVSVSQIQAAVRRLEREDLITKNSANHWAINHPDLRGWIKEYC